MSDATDCSIGPHYQALRRLIACEKYVIGFHAAERLEERGIMEWQVVAGVADGELIIPPDDPSEPCYEAETIQLLREVKERAERGDVEWLAQHGKVYEAMDAV